MNNARKATAFDLKNLRIVVMRNVSFLAYPSGDEPGPRRPARQKLVACWPTSSDSSELLLDEDELGAVDVVVGSDAGAELWTEDVSGDEAAELSDTVESAAVDATGAASVVVDGAVDAAEA